MQQRSAYDRRSLHARHPTQQARRLALLAEGEKRDCPARARIHRLASESKSKVGFLDLGAAAKTSVEGC